MRNSSKTISNSKMIEREIVLSSFSVKTGGNKPENFTTKFNQPIDLDPNEQYVVGLNRIINMSFTWYNINAGRQNQLIRFSSDNGKTFSDIAFPAGVWEYKRMNEFIQKATVVKQAGKDDFFPINLSFSPTTFRVTITLATNYQLDLTQSNFYDLIGFDKKILKDEVNLGPRVPNLSQDTEMLNVHCDLTNSSLVDGEESDIIYSFSTSTLRRSYGFTMEPMRVTFSPVNKNRISSIRVYITDGKRRIVNLNGADTAFSLILKKQIKGKVMNSLVIGIREEVVFSSGIKEQGRLWTIFSSR